MKKTIFVVIVSTSFCSLFSGMDSPKTKVAKLTGTAILTLEPTKPIAVPQSEDSNQLSTRPSTQVPMWYDTPCGSGGTSPVFHHAPNAPKSVTLQDNAKPYFP